jgi:hypothetical protein
MSLTTWLVLMAAADGTIAVPVWIFPISVTVFIGLVGIYVKNLLSIADLHRRVELLEKKVEREFAAVTEDIKEIKGDFKEKDRKYSRRFRAVTSPGMPAASRTQPGIPAYRPSKDDEEDE